MFQILLTVIGLRICPGARPYTFHEHKRVTNNPIRSKFTFSSLGFILISLTHLQCLTHAYECLQVKENGKRNTECENKISETRVSARAWNYPLEQTQEACKSTGYLKITLKRELRRSSGRPVYKSSPLEREISLLSKHPTLQKVLGARNLSSSVGSPARADLKIQENLDCVLELPLNIQTNVSHNLRLQPHIFLY